MLTVVPVCRQLPIWTNTMLMFALRSFWTVDCGFRLRNSSSGCSSQIAFTLPESVVIVGSTMGAGVGVAVGWGVGVGVGVGVRQ